jgi:hypothetical protein
MTGQACYTGLAGTIVTANLTSATNTVLNGASLTRQSPKAVLTDGAGNVVAQGFARQTDSLAIKFTPVSALTPPTRADAAAKVLLPANGTVVTLADTGIASFDGDWNYEGDATITTNPTGAIEIAMTVTRKGGLSGVNPQALAAVN